MLSGKWSGSGGFLYAEGTRRAEKNIGDLFNEIKMIPNINNCIILFDEILYCAFLDDFITLDDFKEISTYGDKLTRYLKECLEWVEYTNMDIIRVI